MGRRRKAETETTETKPVAKVRSLLGHNIPPEVLKRHYAAVGALKAKLRTMQGELAAAWKAAEADGIDKKAGKLVFNLFDMDPATADIFLRDIQQYATQLGLFDKIDDWKSAEDQEANAGSADRAECDLKKPAQSEPKSGGRDEAIYAQGFEAGQNGAPIHDCPLFNSDDDRDTWQRGHHDGALQRVDAQNSDLASA